MSKESVRQLFGKIGKDEGLQKKYAELIRQNQIDSEKILAERLIELGKTAGFTFSKDDLLAARAEVSDRINAGRELQDDDLNNVAGGITTGCKSNNVLLSVVSLGVVCAAQSILTESQERGACGNVMSTTAKCH